MTFRSRKGFTIIELLVAVGVTALLVTLMINIVTSILTNWNRSSGSLSSGNQARLALDQISQDLQGAILKNDGNVWLAATIRQNQPVPFTGHGDESWTTGKPPTDSLAVAPSGLSIEDYRFGRGGVWLRFFCTPSGANTASDLTTISAPRAVAYQILRRQIGGSGSAYVYQLFRSEVTPDVTFAQGYDLYATTNTYSGASGSVTASGVAETIRNPVPQNVIASGIVDFGIRLYVKDTNDTNGDSNTNDPVEAFPVDRTTSTSGSSTYDAFAATSSTSSLTDPGAGTNIGKGSPIAAEVMIRVLTPEGIRLIEAFETTPANFPNDTWWGIVEQNSNVYTRRIDIKSTAL